MSITDVRKDPSTCTMTVTSEWDAPVPRVWELWADPRKLERWWGPPTFPATVSEHDLRPGGTVRYVMTGPAGEQHHGFWNVVAVDPPLSLVADDGFADAEGNLNRDLPVTRFTITLTERPGGTRMVIESKFDSPEHLQQVLDMGMEEGLTAAMSQIDAILAEG